MLANQLGGLASLAGIRMPNTSGSRDGQLSLQSRSLVEAFIARNGLLKVSFSSNQRKIPLCGWQLDASNRM